MLLMSGIVEKRQPICLIKGWCPWVGVFYHDQAALCVDDKYEDC